MLKGDYYIREGGSFLPCCAASKTSLCFLFFYKFIRGIFFLFLLKTMSCFSERFISLK